MKTLDELWEECERVNRAFDRCQVRLHFQVCKDPEYIRTNAACDVAFAAYTKAQDEAYEGKGAESGRWPSDRGSNPPTPPLALPGDTT